MLLAVEAVRRAGLKDFRLRFGDIALFYALLDALALPERWRLKLRHYFWRPQAFHALLARLAKGERAERRRPDRRACRKPRRAQTPERAEELVAAYLDAAGPAALPATARLARSPRGCSTMPPISSAEPLPREVATVIDYYLAVSGAAARRPPSASP